MKIIIFLYSCNRSSCNSRNHAGRSRLCAASIPAAPQSCRRRKDADGQTNTALITSERVSVRRTKPITSATKQLELILRNRKALVRKNYFSAAVTGVRLADLTARLAPSINSGSHSASSHALRRAYSSTRLNHEPIGHDRDIVVSLIESGVSFRVSANPDSWKPVDSHDKAQDKALAEWIDAGMSGAAEMKEIYALSHVRQLPVSRGTDKQVRRTQLDTDTLNTTACDRVVNGLSYQAGHCLDCDRRLSCIANDKARDVYRIRDYLGRIITTDSVMLSSSKRVGLRLRRRRFFWFVRTLTAFAAAILSRLHTHGRPFSTPHTELDIPECLKQEWRMSELSECMMKAITSAVSSAAALRIRRRA